MLNSQVSALVREDKLSQALKLQARNRLAVVVSVITKVQTETNIAALLKLAREIVWQIYAKLRTSLTRTLQMRMLALIDSSKT